MFPRRIHALPEPLVTAGGHLAVAHGFAHRRGLEITVFRIVEITRQELPVDDHEAAVDVAAGPQRFFGKAGHAVAVELHFAESPLGVDGGDRQQPA